MSLISDPGYLVHSLRLSYLRNVDDPYGSRIISLNPSYTSNPYILAASLADVQRWPELEYPHSPQISDDENYTSGKNASSSGFPGATSLKHHQTIMGSRSGALGLRVSGKRESTSKRASKILSRSEGRNGELDATPNPSTSRIGPPSTVDGDGRAKPPEQEVAAVVQPAPTPIHSAEPTTKEVQFIPKFKGAAEMEARRKLRMQARRGPLNSAPKPSAIISGNLNPELSSSDEDEAILEEDNEDDFDIIAPADENMDEADEFDPEFAATRSPGVNFDSASDLASILSGTASAISTSNPSALGSSSYVMQHIRTRSRLSPVSEVRAAGATSGVNQGPSRPVDSYFEMVPPPLRAGQKAEPAPRRTDTRPRAPTLLQNVTSPQSEMTFMRRPVGPTHPQVSALTAVLASSGSSSNPFSENYGAISGRGETAAMDVKIFFPHARKPSGDVLALNVRKDATVEEVIGFALWNYWEEGWLPKLDENAVKDDPKLTAVGWIMRIAEDDGELDDDFPPPDRTEKISKFNIGAFAILAASSTQIQQNQQLESKIRRRPSRIVAAPRRPDVVGASSLAPPSVPGLGTSTFIGSMSLLSSSLGPSSSHGPQIFLRIRVADTADAVHISTTIPVSAGMYMQEALELVCRRRKLANPKDYALILNDLNILIPLDRTVASLQGKRELTLVKRSMLPQMGIDPETRSARTTDPNASIFKRNSDVPDMQTGTTSDYTAAYKKFTIYRKMPMLARQERTLAIDGVYIHIMPSANKAKAVFDSGKTVSFHIKSVVACQQSSKSSTIFKLVVQRDTLNKRYDFEADTPKLAGDICQTVKTLKNALERSGTMNRSSRRSRHVV
ncbi:stress-activated map kinase interacting protein 1-domain-containing protein [Hygrophoropsis aurantiaca]|uniref:Stress-activated map kinase interacting protein 1-domain-containing protein n=1 Tax=Hygrophoropsis aurantiaca TaxID=72124 RepID=A0ACB8AD23_9AGAM|nr:stress-activated map kinase interacting protein 1-domain-containing protein [Hygrophoropsis aurantiaca]